MIISFRNKETERLYVTGRCRTFPKTVGKVGVRKLSYLNHAKTVKDLRVPPGNRLKKLGGSYEGKYSIRINVQYRIVFRFIDGDAHDVEIVDYH